MRRSIAFVLSLALAAPLAAARIDPDLLAGMEVRSIGPAAMSGRIAAVDAAESNPDLLWVGSASGGVWKSENGGLTFRPVFDDQPVASIGAVAIFQPNPDVVWVGTGEGNPRNSVSVGDGVYRTLDGGRTWKHLGLAATERIHRIVLDPRDPDVAYVAALGRAWGENPERGVFKTVDGGKSWRKVLYVDERTGAGDLAMDPANPNKLFAAMWQYRRWPWAFRSGGPGSGLYVTYDGGESWRRSTEEDGLPKGDLGRIGLAISRSNPEIVYALVEAAKSALLRSEDGGKTWKTASDDPRVAERPFYYADIRVDPAWPNRVYNLQAQLKVSEDAGQTFAAMRSARTIHGDYHAMWIDPKDPRHIVVGEDGGLGVSRDRGATWDFVANLPVGQFYHVALDGETPYNVYGGMQDNGSWRGPASVWEEGGVRNQHWVRIGIGDGFDARPDPADSRSGYSLWQGGNLVRWNVATAERKYIRPPEPLGRNGKPERLRFNWNAGLATDPFEPATVYLGSQYLWKSSDRGETWTAISPDLTTNNPEWQKQDESGGLTPEATAAENFTTIITIAPSPLERGLLWVGTDDGRLHVTRDGGKSWTSVEKNVRGVPAGTWIPHLLPSRFDPGTAFVVFDDHRRSNFETYLARTDDFGKTWRRLPTAGVRGWALAVEQDPVDRDLLFLGTELGLWVSFDGGENWLPWRHGLPTVSVMDLAIHPRDQDLVIATHGRALYVLDDLRPLREMTPESLAEPLHLYGAADALQHRMLAATGASRAGAGDFSGTNRPYGAILTYSLNLPGLPLPDDEKERARKEKERAAAKPATEPAGRSPRQEDLPGPGQGAAGAEEKAEEPAEPEGKGKDREPKAEIRIADASGKRLRTLKGPAKLGVNRAVWDLTRDAYKQPPDEEEERGPREPEGPEVPPGTYAVTVAFRGREAKGTVRVLPDPRSRTTEAGWQERWAAIERAGALQERIAQAIDRVATAREDVHLVIARLEKAEKAKRESGAAGAGQAGKSPLAKSARDLEDKLDAIEKRLWIPPKTQGLFRDRDLLTKAGNLIEIFDSSWDAPNESQRGYIRNLEIQAADVLGDFDRLFAEDVAAFRRQVEAAGIGLLPAEAPLAVPPGG